MSSLREIKLATNLQAVAVSVTLDKEITIYSLYIHPNFYLETGHLDTLLKQLPSSYIYVGDLNGHNILWGCRDNNPKGDIIEDRIYPTELQLNRANSSDTEAPFLDLNLCISNGTVSTKIYDKRDDFDFDIINFPFLDGDVPRRTSYGVYISQLIRFARASSNVNDFNYLNKALTAKLLRQGYRYFKLRKAFSKFYRRHSALLEKYSVSLKTLLQQGISEPEFYGDLVYRFRKIVGKSNFSEQFRKLINRYKRIGYSLDIMRQTACLVVNPIIVDGYASFFNCTTAVRASDPMTASS